MGVPEASRKVFGLAKTLSHGFAQELPALQRSRRGAANPRFAKLLNSSAFQQGGNKEAFPFARKECPERGLPSFLAEGTLVLFRGADEGLISSPKKIEEDMISSCPARRGESLFVSSEEEKKVRRIFQSLRSVAVLWHLKVAAQETGNVSQASRDSQKVASNASEEKGNKRPTRIRSSHRCACSAEQSAVAIVAPFGRCTIANNVSLDSQASLRSPSNEQLPSGPKRGAI